MSADIPAIPVEPSSPLAAEFRIRYPEFLDPPEGQKAATLGQIEYWLKEADLELSDVSWPEKIRTKAMMAWAAAHIALALRREAMGAGTGESGPVASASVGGESVSYASNGKYGQGTFPQDWWLSVPPYGLEYLKYQQENMSGCELTRAFGWEA